MCDQCRERELRDKSLWEGIRLGLIGIQRGLGAIIKAIEKSQGVGDRQKPVQLHSTHSSDTIKA